MLHALRTRGNLYTILNHTSPISLKSKLHIYLSYIRPIITYAENPGATLLTFQLEEIESFQNKTIRYITVSPLYGSNKVISDSANIQKIQNINYFHNVLKQIALGCRKNSNYKHLNKIGLFNQVPGCCHRSWRNLLKTRQVNNK